jgi:hypothetical protein
MNSVNHDFPDAQQGTGPEVRALNGYLQLEEHPFAELDERILAAWKRRLAAVPGLGRIGVPFRAIALVASVILVPLFLPV